MKELIITPLDFPEILKTALDIQSSGYLEQSFHYFYLKIDDDYIHRLFPLFQDKMITKPDYFNRYTMGAHITIVYPEENKLINEQELGKEHHFKIKEIFSTVIGLKRYYALLVEAPTLLQLRKKYGLSSQLLFKNHWIDFHITFGVCQITS